MVVLIKNQGTIMSAQLQICESYNTRLQAQDNIFLGADLSIFSVFILLSSLVVKYPNIY